MPTTIKQALKKWEEATGRKSGEAKEIKLIGVYPPIEKVLADPLRPSIGFSLVRKLMMKRLFKYHK